MIRQSRPLYRALTRPSMTLMVPTEYFALWLGLTGITFLAVGFWQSLLVGLPLYGVMFILGHYEPRFLRILWIVAFRVGFPANRRIHKGWLYRV